MKHHLFLVLFLQLACASVSVHIEEPAKSTSHTHYSHYMLFGLFGFENISSSALCAEADIIKVKNYISFEDFLFTVVTLGIYTPKSLKVWCRWSDLPDKEMAL